MKRGITLIAIGNRGYFNWAVNMACSIIYYSPDVKIQLLVAPEFKADATSCGLFDIVTVLNRDSYTDSDNRLFPAKLKLSLYDYIAFDETIYLDVDGMVVKDITPLFETKANISGDIQGVYERAQGDAFEGLKWCRPATIWAHYQLPENAKLPAINSSYMFIRKCEEIKLLFAQAHDNLMLNPIHTDKHWHSWGHKKPYKVTQPDELYFDVAMAQLGIVPEHRIAVYFRLIIDGGEVLKIEDVRKNYYAVGLFGDLRTNHRSVRDIYDRHMPEVYEAIMGLKFHNKSELLAKSKFAVS